MEDDTTYGQLSKTTHNIVAFDAVQLSLNTVSGVDRHIVLTSQRLTDILNNKGSLKFGHSASLDSLIFDKASSCGSASVDMSSLHPLPWLSSEGCRVGGAMCHLTSLSKAGCASRLISPRAIALEQIAKLKEEFGLEIQSAFEMEFMVYKNDEKEPYINKARSFYGRIDSLAGYESVFFNICQSLVKAGLPVETFLTEMAAGQFEITFSPQKGVAATDSVSITKDGLRKFLAKAELVPTFMATPKKDDHCNGFHFNHSLLKTNNCNPKTKDGNCYSNPENNKSEDVNVFYDPNKSLSLSSTLSHWLAGLIEHGPGLALISSPTFNCTRRLQDEVTPKRANWGVENRSAFLRVRNSKANVYIENRLPSSASNPYLVLAGVVAAGMDGLRRQLVRPPQMDQAAPHLPNTLEEELQCLENDTVLQEALGHELISSFLGLTREAISMKESRNLEDLDQQKEIYFKCI